MANAVALGQAARACRAAPQPQCEWVQPKPHIRRHGTRVGAPAGEAAAELPRPARNGATSDRSDGAWHCGHRVAEVDSAIGRNARKSPQLPQ